MRSAKWWTHETIFVMAMGAVMLAVFGTSMFAKRSVGSGSPVIEQMLDYEKACQTITDKDVDDGVHKHC
jgi:hypothetical protein